MTAIKGLISMIFEGDFGSIMVNISERQPGKAVCGNDLCEPGLGETKENCPKDCSAGD